MYKGDISNQVVPKLVLVFEGLIGSLPDEKAKVKYSKYMKKEKFKEAANLFELNETIAHHIMHIHWHLNFNLDVITFTHPGLADELQARLENENYPIGRVTYTTPSAFSMNLAYRPDIAMVYDADPSRVFTFGSKGTIVNTNYPRFI